MAVAALVLALLLPGSALAQDAPPALEPPRPLGPTEVPYPAGAPPHEEPVTVRVRLVVGTDGTVRLVQLLDRSHEAFEEAVLVAVAGFTFAPAREGGVPVAVELTFEHTFLPPPPPTPAAQAAPEGPALDAALRGTLRERGTRRPVKGAAVDATVGGVRYATTSGADGRFELPLPSGEARVEVSGSGYERFVAEETLEAGRALEVGYWIDRTHVDPFEAIVVGEKRREEVSSVTLRGPELKTVPGTFGDPFRVVQALPGVASMASLLPFPIVRGASPSSTGFLLDGTRVPALFHLLAGPSVIHPEFIDEVQFYPGGAPVPYGGYVGGVVDGRTRRARADESLVDVDLNLLQTGGLVREPVGFLGSTVTAAGRIGYPGVMLSLATAEASLSYWDYQLRLDRGDARDRLTVFVFGSRDELLGPAPDADPLDPEPELVPVLALGFHRVDLRYQHGRGPVDVEYRLVAGIDQTQSAGTDVSTVIVEPAVIASVALDERLTLVTGLEGSVHDYSQGDAQLVASDSANIGDLTEPLERLTVGSALAEVLWRPTPRWLFRPGVRGDVYDDGKTTLAAADPRLTVRYRVADRTLPAVDEASEQSGVWLKGGVGLYHQPPRFFLPLPGLDVMPLEYGLLSAIQTSAGVEVPLAQRVGLDVTGFYNHMDPVVFDASTNPLDVVNEANPTLVPTTTEPPPDAVATVIDRLIEPQLGRSFGVETLLRRRAGEGLYGWVAYTLSVAERRKDDAWVAYDYDRTHLLNLVGGLALANGWDVGARLQYGSGKPATTTYGYNTARIDGYYRLDVRVDRHVVWNTWLLDFYVDLTNVAVFSEEVSPGNELRYVLPTVGLRGRL